MCLAAWCSQGKSLTPEEVRTAWANNPDGGGFLYFSSDGRPVVYRTLHLRKFERAYRKAVESPHPSGMAVHFRYATHGSTGIDGVHPFRINSTDYLMHNGVLPIPTDGVRSDTRTFAEDYLAQLPARWYQSSELSALVSDFVHGSKLVVATSDPEARHRFFIVRDSDGVWEGERSAWYSNLSHRSARLPAGSTAGSKWSRPAEWRGALADVGLQAEDTCVLCGLGPTEYGVCEACEACVGCLRDLPDCECGSALDLGGMHTLTDAEYRLTYGGEA